MSKVYLIIPRSPFLIKETVFPNLGILYVASYLIENDVKVEVIDLHVENENKIRQIEAKSIVGFTATTPEFYSVLQLLKQVEDNNTSVVGGPHATVAPEECKDFNCIVVGEGEEAMLRIVDGERGLIVGKEIENLDTLPFPARHLIDIKKYSYLINWKKSTSMITSRGCPFRCAFCCKTTKKVRFRSANNVCEEIKEVKKLGYEGIMFYDDIFTLRKDLDEICYCLKQNNMVWRCFIRSSHIDFNTLKLMKESGCYEVGMGVESGSQEILDIIDKRITIEEVKRVTKWCKQLNLKIKHFYILGLPSESKETIKETENLILQTKPNDFDLTLFAPYPKSSIFDNKEKYDINWKDWHVYYKSAPNLYFTNVSTSKITSEELMIERERIEKKIKKYLRCYC